MRFERHVYNLSSQIFMSYLILLSTNTKKGQAFINEQEELENDSFKDEETLQKDVMERFFGTASLYNNEIGCAIAEIQHLDCNGFK